MKPYLLALSTLAFSGLALAQEPTCTWASAAQLDLSGTIFSQSPAYQIAADPAGGALLMGMSQWVTNYGANSFGGLQFVHYQNDGTVDWLLECPGVSYGFRVEYAPDGSFHACGEFLDSLRLDPNHLLSTTDAFPHLFYAKLDVWGDVMWALDLTAELGDVRDPRALTFDGAGNSYIGLNADGDTRVVKFDPDGNVLLTIEQNPPSLFGVEVDALGYVYVTGSCAPASNTVFGGVTFEPNVSGNGYNRYLVRYRPDGTPTWAKFSGDVTCSTSEVLSFGPEGVYWVGAMVDAADFDSHHLIGPANGSSPDMHICRLDSSGNYEWVEEGPVGQNIGVAPGIRHYLDLDEEGNLLVAGSGRGLLDWGNGVVTEANGARDALLMCFAPGGGILWQKRGNSTGQFDEAHGVARAADGSIYIAGLTRNDIAFDQQSVTAPGAVNYPFVARFAPEVNTGMPAPITSAQGIFPVPASDRLWLHGGTAVRKALCTDALGRITPLQVNDGSIDVGSLATGTYALTLETTKGERMQRRFVKE